MNRNTITTSAAIATSAVGFFKNRPTTTIKIAV
jgi:hypothetical protein